MDGRWCKVRMMVNKNRISIIMNKNKQYKEQKNRRYKDENK